MKRKCWLILSLSWFKWQKQLHRAVTLVQSYDLYTVVIYTVRTCKLWLRLIRLGSRGGHLPGGKVRAGSPCKGPPHIFWAWVTSAHGRLLGTLCYNIVPYSTETYAGILIWRIGKFFFTKLPKLIPSNTRARSRDARNRTHNSPQRGHVQRTRTYSPN